ncbi:MAG TPA: hypothetical protein VH062_19255 [Polyangiaceae bacterium]|jgi:hypothetical protein|nr:hypothetical protein [Polyangiaceae bacterium]
MNTELLIDAIVRQTTVLIAHLATARGARTPLADIAEQVFSELARELHRQGVSRKVAADMFGLALRTYRRKVQRLAESQTLSGRSLWEAVHAFLVEREVATQSEVLAHFHRDDLQIVRGVLKDLVDSGLVYRAGRGRTSVYRVASRADLERVTSNGPDVDGTDMLVWALVYRLGPVSHRALAEHVALPGVQLEHALARLVEAGRVSRNDALPEGVYSAAGFVAPLGDPRGWEASVFDHFQAVVTTICRKLGAAGAAASGDTVGGSTYTLEVWPEHPLEAEVFGQLADFRRRLADLRARVLEHNRSVSVPRKRSKVVVYGGQSFNEHEDADDDENS